MYPTLEAIQTMDLNNYAYIPIAKEIYADFITPIEAMRILKAHSHNAFLLESVEDTKQWGRYSFLGYDPTLEITCVNGTTSIKIAKQANPKILTSNPKAIIREILATYKSPKIPNMPPFSGGLVGYFSYDYIRYIEERLDFDVGDRDFKDIDLMLFENVIVFDNFRQKILLITNIPLKNLDQSYTKAIETLNTMESLLQSKKYTNPQTFHLDSALESDCSEEEYCAMVEKAKQYIFEGDIFQVVLSNPLRAKASGSLFDVYRVLRVNNPSPYMFYFSSDNQEIAGASPETLVKLIDSRLYTYPLAGSRPRGKDYKEDKALQEELLHDTKELAEHNMLVDLGRNDIGKIAQIGSIEVQEYLKVVKYSHIMHISSVVSGIIRPDKDAIDAIDAILPAGTLSGAPKIRACEIIHELEGSSRGIYGGAIGYLDFSGNMDMCIAIRLVYKKGDEVCVRSGAGIVYDSIPKNEYKECQNKAQAVVNALHTATGGL